MTIPAVLRSAAFAALLVFSAFAGSVDGKWTGKSPEATFEFKVDGTTLTGTANGVPIAEGKIDGEAISFSAKHAQGGAEAMFRYEGKVTGDDLSLTRTSPDGKAVHLTAKRAPSAT